MLHIKVPATSANMGPGFDTIGMAFQLYNHLWVEPSDKELEIIFKRNTGHYLPANKTNLIYRTIQQFYKEYLPRTPVPGLRLVQEDYIPPTRGLGSSAACIVAGLLAANHISGLNLSREKLIDLAAGIEGHPDNSTPALTGGIAVGVMKDKSIKSTDGSLSEMEHLEYIKLDGVDFSRLSFAVMIPDFPLSTEKARQVVPDSFSRHDAVFNASRTALLTAAFLTGDFSKLSFAMDDRFHQPYRSSLVPDMDEICARARELGATAVFLSGAGPTLIAVMVDGDNDLFKSNMSAYLNQLAQKWDFVYLAPDLEGASIQDEEVKIC